MGIKGIGVLELVRILVPRGLFLRVVCLGCTYRRVFEVVPEPLKAARSSSNR